MASPREESRSFVEIIEGFIRTIKSDSSTPSEKRNAATRALALCLPIVEASIEVLKPHRFVGLLLHECLKELNLQSGGN